MGNTSFASLPRARTTLLATCLCFLVASWAAGQSGIWTTKAPMPSPRWDAAAGVIEGKMYVAGGTSVTGYSTEGTTYEYDPKTDSWHRKAPIPTTREIAAGAVVDGILYVIGGGGSSCSPTVEAYNPKTDAWISKAPLHTPRCGAAVGVVDGIIYIAGGANTGGTLASVEAYDPRTDTWATKGSMPTAREPGGSAVIDEILYVAGGAESSTVTGALEAYDPKTDSWSVRTPMPTPRWGMAAAVLDGKFYTIGGMDPSKGPVGVVEVYDPKTNSWTTAPTMPTARWSPAAGVVDDVVFVLGGGWNHAVNEALTPFLMVSIDIKPGDATNTINLKSNGVVPVAILGSATFDPMTVDPTTVTLAGAHVASRGRGVPMTGQADVNGDGYPDLILYFRTQDLQLTPRSTEAVLYGTTYSGQRIRGSDTVRLVPPPKLNASPFRPMPSRGRGVSGR